MVAERVIAMLAHTQIVAAIVALLGVWGLGFWSGYAHGKQKGDERQYALGYGDGRDARGYDAFVPPAMRVRDRDLKELE